METNKEKPVICETCRFYDQTKQYKHGVCRQHAPFNNVEGVTLWPPVNYNDWCGEHQPYED